MTEATKALAAKAVNIQGKKYVLVSDRVIFFNETYPNGAIQTEELETIESSHVKIKATVIPDIEKPLRFFTGHSQEVVGSSFINKTSALENAETSAVGRALALMGIGVIDSIASVDEIHKAKQYDEPQKPARASKPAQVERKVEGMTKDQAAYIAEALKAIGQTFEEVFPKQDKTKLTKDQAEAVIVSLRKHPALSN